jgi:hypothetical protein
MNVSFHVALGIDEFTVNKSAHKETDTKTARSPWEMVFIGSRPALGVSAWVSRRPLPMWQR